MPEIRIRTSFSDNDSAQWLTAEGFVGIEGMPSTAKGCRLRLEKLASMYPELKQKRKKGKGFVYHISAAKIDLRSERTDISPDEQLNLWINLFKVMKPASRDKMLQQALQQLAADLAATNDIDS